MLSKVFCLILLLAICSGLEHGVSRDAPYGDLDPSIEYMSEEGLKIHKYIDAYRNDPTNAALAREILSVFDNKALERMFSAADKTKFDMMLTIDDPEIQRIASVYVNKTQELRTTCGYYTCFALYDLLMAGTLITYGGSYDDQNCFDKCNGYSVAWRRQVSTGVCVCISDPWGSPIATSNTDWHGNFYANAIEGSNCVVNVSGMQFWSNAIHHTTGVSSWANCKAYCLSFGNPLGIPIPVQVWENSGDCWCCAVSGWFSTAMTANGAFWSGVTWSGNNC